MLLCSFGRANSFRQPQQSPSRQKNERQVKQSTDVIAVLSLRTILAACIYFGHTCLIGGHSPVCLKSEQATFSYFPGVHLGAFLELFWSVCCKLFDFSVLRCCLFLATSMDLAKAGFLAFGARGGGRGEGSGHKMAGVQLG